MRRIVLTAVAGASLFLTASAESKIHRHHAVRAPLVQTQSPVPAPTVWFYFAQQGDLTGSDLSKAEAALAAQANNEVRAHWGTPVIAFGSAGIPIYMDTDAQIVQDCGQFADGCHGVANGQPAIWVRIIPFDYETQALSHELVETLTDALPNPTLINGMNAESADPVYGNQYPGVGDVMLSDFVYPQWYSPGTSGPWDFSGATTGPLRPTRFGY